MDVKNIQEPWQINSNATLKIQETDFAARSAGRWRGGTSELAQEGTRRQMQTMRSIAKSYVSEKLCFEPMYKENYSESIEQIQPKEQ